jgi:uncharacterized membrane protein HdeD (DUF308 family)
MQKNVGPIDKLIRSILALVLIYLYANGTLSGTVGIVALVIAAIFIITSLTGFCFVYTLFGINTDKKK